MKDLLIKKVDNPKELSLVYKIREIVFIKEQNVPKEREMDKYDSHADHFIIYAGRKPVGCARVRFYRKLIIWKTAKLERVAILKRYRKYGYGRQLMEFLIDYCRRNGVNKIILHSQIQAAGFYEKLGFRKYGNVFMDAGIKHIEMYKPI